MEPVYKIHSPKVGTVQLELELNGNKLKLIQLFDPQSVRQRDDAYQQLIKARDRIIQDSNTVR